MVDGLILHTPAKAALAEGLQFSLHLSSSLSHFLLNMHLHAVLSLSLSFSLLLLLLALLYVCLFHLRSTKYQLLTPNQSARCIEFELILLTLLFQWYPEVSFLYIEINYLNCVK